MRPLKHVYCVFTYYLSWLVFGLVGIALNVVCGLLLLWPRRDRFGPPVRRTIRALFGFWVKWQHASRITEVRWRGFDESPPAPGTVYVANHPTLVDATFLLARLPDAICIFKSALLRNPFIGPAAILAGYSSGDTGLDLIRDAVEKVAGGRALLIFPEGTRTTPGNRLNPLKPGFALIAQRAGAPIRMVTIHASDHFLPRGRPWWQLPEFPLWIEFGLDEEIPADTSLSVSEIAAAVEQRFLQKVHPVAARRC